jgi:6-phosphogluconate dehydrogenase (decarboxylating)
MGWGRTLLLGDIGNRLDIEDTERDIDVIISKINENFKNDMSRDQKIAALIQENAEMKLYLASTIRLLMAKGNITQKELEAMVESVDAEDGKTDGRFDADIV